MRQQLNMIMVGVRDLQKLRTFYEAGLGWTSWLPADDRQAMYRVGSIVLTLLPQTYLAAESGVPLASTPKSFWVLFTSSKSEVDEVIAKALSAGGSVTSVTRQRDYDVYSGYVADPEGNGWEIAWTPHMGPDATGHLELTGQP